MNIKEETITIKLNFFKVIEIIKVLNELQMFIRGRLNKIFTITNLRMIVIFPLDYLIILTKNRLIITLLYKKVMM